jgi:copper resistance protein C
MRRMFMMLLITLICTLPTMVFAHTELSSSSPEAGQVVTEEMEEISLTFGGEIEALSTMTLVKDGQELEFGSVEVQGNQLIGKVEQPLESGSYVINWNIAGEDGHPISGEIPFTVQLPQEDIESEEEQSEKVEEPMKQEESQDESTNATDSENNSEDHNNIIKTLVPVVAILLLVVGLVVLFRKKK